MAAPYSTRFILAQLATPGFGAEYTVPAGRLAIIRCVTWADVVLGGPGSEGAIVLDPGPFVVLGQVLTPGQTLVSDQLHIVVAEGETIKTANTLGVFHVSVSGYLLTQ